MLFYEMVASVRFLEGVYARVASRRERWVSEGLDAQVISPVGAVIVAASMADEIEELLRAAEAAEAEARATLPTAAEERAIIDAAEELAGVRYTTVRVPPLVNTYRYVVSSSFGLVLLR